MESDYVAVPENRKRNKSPKTVGFSIKKLKVSQNFF